LDGRDSQKFNYRALEPLPEGWHWRVASDVCDLITSGATPSSDLMYANDGDVPFLKVYNIAPSDVIDFTIKPTFIDFETHNGKLRRSRVRPGDVLTNIVGPPLGKTAVVPDGYPEWNINQAIVAFRAGPEILPSWLALLLRSPFILDRLKATSRATAGQFNIALSTCRDLPLPVPPLVEQEELVELAESVNDTSQRLAARAGDLSRQSTLMRRSLLAAAFDGKLLPQDPADEPASKLLERIRAQEGSSPKPKRARHIGPQSTTTSLTYTKEELPL
jgi:type I restriction enzyme S subunit